MNARYIFGQKLIRAAGAFLRTHMKDNLIIEEKSGPKDLVTQLDRQVQDYMTHAILEAFPEDSIFGEESTDHPSVVTGHVWVLDPIDGTTNFITQGADFAILVAFLVNGVGQFGLIYDVMNDILYHGGSNFPVYKNNILLPPAPSTPIENGLIGINQGLYTQNPNGIRTFANRMLGTRCIGSAGLSFAYVLTQRYRSYVSYIYPWDYLAGMILGEALGYSLMTLSGERPSFFERELDLMVPTTQLEYVKGYLKT